ncbi:patatin-like phospholipase family protein [Proteocatella sphenisci]|uniref:patatin-like phospholipase family protein n=1 Tax=Proteocatella sphenisci TaxID=181070 RepID=UPI00048ED5D0|nr:patatin family protein [Proteocatella sphenisci]
MKRGLVVEGGAMRAVFTCGVFDALLDGGIEVDYFIGVSAGIANGVSYLSRQRGRGKDILIGYANDPRYMGTRNFFNPKNRSYYGIDFAFRQIPIVHNPFDFKAYKDFKGQVKAVVSNLETGKPQYLDVCADESMMDIIIASCSLPLMFPVKKINGVAYLDGGVSDPIPVKKAIEDGCDKVLVILSREEGYKKGPEKGSRIIENKFRKHREFRETLKRRPDVYNEQVDFVNKLESEGIIKVIRPNSTQGIGRLEKDTEKLGKMYNDGYNSTMLRIEEIREYMSL